MAKKRKLLKDLTRVGRRINEQRRKSSSPLWRRKALALWSFLVRALAGFECEACKVSGKVKVLNSHHILAKERYQWLMFAPINGVCLCKDCHKTGRHSAHQNPIWFAVWLKLNKPHKYRWAIQHCADEPMTPPDFRAAYDHLYRRIFEMGFGAALAAKLKSKKRTK